VIKGSVIRGGDKQVIKEQVIKTDKGVKLIKGSK
jgi:hypothetical protein